MLPARAGELQTVQDGSRSIEVFWQPVPDARATLLLFSGGRGGFGSVFAGRPSSSNFLVRTLDLWQARGFNVACFGELHARRHSEQHLADIRAVVQWLEKASPAPIALVGTSRGTISAAYAAAGVHDPRVRALVLTSSMQELAAYGGLADITVPVLVLSHEHDACAVTSPGAGPSIVAALKQAPRHEFVLVSGGVSLGRVCGPMAYHGFDGIEPEVVGKVATWLDSAVDTGPGAPTR